MAIAAKQKASARMVVLLRPSEKQRLQRLARKERVSSAEIIRRSLSAYAEPELNPDAQVIAEMNLALDKALADIRSARAEVQQNLAQIRKMRAERA